MKVSLNTAKFYAGMDLPGTSLEELVMKVGAQLGAIEEVIDYGKRYDGIVIAKVTSCVKHPNADKLSICTIDDGGITPDVNRGEDGYVQVVCGAPNVREGLYVAWIPPGVIVPTTYDKDPFVLEAREIRGELSNGMLASASELAISDDHSGILEININELSEPLTKPGTEFKKLFGLDDVILDIENKMFTHRPDCFGVLGVAREIFGIYGEVFVTPEWYLKVPKIFLKDSETEIINRLKLEIRNEVPELVPRFMAVAMDNVEIAPSPYWLQALLTRIGVKPINNVVDLTNYLSYVTGQPLHAYDYDKVDQLTDAEGAVLMARMPNPGEKVALLNGKTIEPRKEAIMIATDKELIGFGGVMGGTSTEVDNDTTRIIVECANFDMYSIRKTSMAHGLFTDAVTRFNKGQSPLQNDRVIVEVMRMVEMHANGKQASQVIDDRHIEEETYTRQTINPGVKTSVDYINSRLGLELSKEEINGLLRNVGFACIETQDSGEIEVHAPFWRTDIQLAEDIVEEVGRLYGFDKLPVVLPSKGIAPSVIEPMLRTKSSLRDQLASYGANELLTYSFVNEKLIKNADQNPDLAFKLSNAISPELQYYRLSLTPSLLGHVHQNIKAGHDEFTLFEIGKVHSKTELDEVGLPREFGRVSAVVASKNTKSPAYYTVRRYLELLGDFTIVPFDPSLTGGHQMLDAMMAPYDPARSAMVVNDANLPVGVIGEFKLSVIKAFKLPDHCAGFEAFLSVFKTNSVGGYTPLSVYPSISQDLCLEVVLNTPYGEVHGALYDAIHSANQDNLNIDISLLDIFAGEELGGKKRITFRLKVNSYERTLTDDSVNALLDRAVATFDPSKITRI